MTIKINGKTISVTTPFDSAVVDLVTGLNKQKQVLAQALNDKGVNVTSTDTLDKMAAEIKDLDVVGAAEYITTNTSLAEISTSSISYPDDTSYNLTLNYRDCIVTINQTAQTITTRRIVGDDNNWTILDSVSDPDIQSMVIYITPNKDHTSFCFCSSSGTGFNFHTYDVDNNGKLTKKWDTAITSISGIVSTSKITYGNLFLNPNADKVFARFKSSSSATFYCVDLQTGEISEFASSSASSFANSSYNIMLAEDLLIGVYVSSNGQKIYKGIIDFSTKTISYSEISFSSGAYASYSILPMPKDNLLATWEADSSSSGWKRTLKIFNLSTGVLLDSIKTRGISFPLDASGTNLSFYTNYNCMSYRLNNNTYEIYGAYTGIAYYDINENKITLPYGAKASYGGYTYNQILLWVSNNGNYNSYSSNPLNTYVSEGGKMFAGSGTGLAPHSLKYSDNSNCTFKKNKTCIGSVYRRNGGEVLFLLSGYFDSNEEANGAYAEKDEVAIVDVES